MRKIWSVRDKWNGEWIARIWKDSNLLNSWIVWFKLSSADSLRFNATLMYMELNNSAFVSILFVSPGKDFRWNVIAIFDALGYKWCFILYWIMCNNKVLLTPLKVRTTNEPLYSWIIVFFSPYPIWNISSIDLSREKRWNHACLHFAFFFVLLWVWH